MSRIHDALRRAQLEREGGLDSAEAAKTDAAIAAELLVSPSAAASAAEEATVEPVTLEMLRERCPVSPWQLGPKAMLFADPNDHTPGSEEFRTLRSRLYQLREKQPLQTLLIASALPAEGKTFVSLNLAQAIAQQRGRSVVVIDADLRISRVHQMLGTSSTPGLTDYLQGEADIFSIVQRGSQDNLFFIPGGKPIANPVELLGTGRLRSLLNHLASVFDWIIIDSPPSVPLSDASLLAEMCDGVLLVVLSGSTPFDMAQKARQEFQDKHLVGVVLNRVPAGLTYSTYYYYYGYGKPPEAKNGKG